MQGIISPPILIRKIETGLLQSRFDSSGPVPSFIWTMATDPALQFDDVNGSVGANGFGNNGEWLGSFAGAFFDFFVNNALNAYAVICEWKVTSDNGTVDFNIGDNTNTGTLEVFTQSGVTDFECTYTQSSPSLVSQVNVPYAGGVIKAGFAINLDGSYNVAANGTLGAPVGATAVPRPGQDLFEPQFFWTGAGDGVYLQSVRLYPGATRADLVALTT